MTLDDLEKLTEASALQMFDDKKEIQSHVLLFLKQDGQSGMVYIPYDNKPELQNHIMNIVGLAKIAGIFNAVCLVGEAWMSTLKKEHEALLPVMRPRLDPDRKEGIFVSVWKDKEKSFRGWFIHREDGKPPTLKPMSDGWNRDTQNNTSWLDVAMKTIQDVPDEVKELAKRKIDTLLTENGEKIK